LKPRRGGKTGSRKEAGSLTAGKDSAAGEAGFKWKLATVIERA
jgi:hypothetical protein